MDVNRTGSKRMPAGGARHRPSGYLVSIDSAWQRIRRTSVAVMGEKKLQPMRRGTRRRKQGGNKSLSGRDDDDDMTDVDGGTRLKARMKGKAGVKKTGLAKYDDHGKADEEENLSLYERLDRKLFQGELTDKRYSDIIRTAHIVTVESSKPGEDMEVFSAREEVTEAEYPDRFKREMTRMILIIERLMNYFAPQIEREGDSEEPEESMTKEMIDFMHEFSNKYTEKIIPKRHFNLARLFKELQENFKTGAQSICLLKVKSVLKFLHLSVIILAIEELRKKLDLGFDYMTKDMKDGWEIHVRLNERYLEISHVRKECVLKQKSADDYWEIEYNVTMSFDAAMRKFSAVRLSLTDLILSESIDSTLAQDLKEKFFDGNFIIC